MLTLSKHDTVYILLIEIFLVFISFDPFNVKTFFFCISKMLIISCAYGSMDIFVGPLYSQFVLLVIEFQI